MHINSFLNIYITMGVISLKFKAARLILEVLFKDLSEMFGKR